MPDADLLRSLLRDRWHLPATGITALPAAVMSRAFRVEAGPDTYVARVVEPSARQPLEAGLAAGDVLRGGGDVIGRPVRTLDGTLTASVPEAAVALLQPATGRPLDARDPIDQQFWGDRLAKVHRALQGFGHPGLRPWGPPDVAAAHLGVEPWLRPSVAAALTATIRLTVTDRLTYGTLHGDPAPGDFVVDPATGRTGVLDCGPGGPGRCYDVAAAVLYAGGTEVAGEFLDGYLSAGPVSPDEMEAALPVLVRFRWAVQADRWARAGDREALRRAREPLEAAAD